MEEIDSKTKISLFAAIGALPPLIGGILWLSTIDSKASAAQESIRGVVELLRDVRERVVRIEENQKRILKE